MITRGTGLALIRAGVVMLAVLCIVKCSGPLPHDVAAIVEKPVMGMGEPFLPSELESLIERVEAAARQGPCDVECRDEIGQTLLHKAVGAGRVDLMRRLVALGADPNATTVFGFTPLDLVYLGHGGPDGERVMRYLESIGARLNFYG